MSSPATTITPAALVATANTAVAAPVPVSPAVEQENDVVESIAYAAPVVLPIVGGVLMFLLAFIAVYMA
ncbi:MAG: hypothetical protein H7224_07610 [Polaromonas sp.]|nr:hypothetical protein [Polaromonas sp.]